MTTAIRQVMINSMLSSLPTHGEGITISGHYGVTITALSKPYTWQDDLPKVITVADDYFTVPLRIELKRRSSAAQTGPIRVEVGTCQTEGMCIPVAIDVASVAPRGSSRRIDCGH